MKVKIFQDEYDEEKQSIEKRLIVSGLIYSDTSYYSREQVTQFVKLNLNIPLFYWNDLSKSIRLKLFDNHIDEFGDIIFGKYKEADISGFINTSLYSEILSTGLYCVFENDYYENLSAQKVKEGDRIALKHTSIFENRIEKMTIGAQYNIIKTIAKICPHRFNSPYWIGFLKSITNSIVDKGMDESRAKIAILSLDILEAISDDLDWIDMYTNVVSSMNERGYKSHVIERIVRGALEKDCEHVLKAVNSVDFKSNHMRTREAIYNEIIKSGLLNTKLARRIRSDTSEFVSNSCIRNLFKELHIYENKNELIEQFLDSKYERVEIELIKNSPDKYLPFLVGVKGEMSKRLLENRIEVAVK